MTGEPHSRNRWPKRVVGGTLIFGFIVAVPSIVALYDSLTHADTPTLRLFSKTDFTSATFAEAVNHFVSVGEDASVRELKSLASGEPQARCDVNERIGWVCRVLFLPKGKEPLRQPLYGALDLPYNSMPPQNWPMYPVAFSGSSYFILSEGYTVEGLSESAAAYIDYCQENGVFRKTALVVPSRAQATADAAALRQSSAWRAIKWTDSGPGFAYMFDEESNWKFIRKQAQSIR